MQPPIRWVPWGLSLGVKCVWREADNSPYLKPRLEINGIVPSPPPPYAFIARTRITLSPHEGRAPVLDHCRIHQLQCVIYYFSCTFMLQVPNKKNILKNDTISCNQLFHKHVNLYVLTIIFYFHVIHVCMN